MRVYLATSSRGDLDKARGYLRKIHQAGHRITLNWVAGIEAEKSMSGNELAGRALADIAAIGASEALIVVMQESMEHRMVGASIEIGAALAAGVPVWIAQEEAKFDHFFTNHPLIRRCSSLARVLERM